MRAFFGATIASILLILYCYCIFDAIRLATSDTNAVLTPGYISILTTVGGLISALVIAELAITKPGDIPVARALGPGDGDGNARARKILSLFAALYVLAWIGAGLSALVVGYLWYPGKIQSLTDVGQSWLGLAVAAAYAYFGLNQQ